MYLLWISIDLHNVVTAIFLYLLSSKHVYGQPEFDEVWESRSLFICPLLGKH